VDEESTRRYIGGREDYPVAMKWRLKRFIALAKFPDEAGEAVPLKPEISGYDPIAGPPAYPDQLYGAENALLPWLWNSIPNALIVDVVGRPTVSVVFAGCPTPTSLVGSLIPSGM
jgi:hypothetical protein